MDLLYQHPPLQLCTHLTAGLAAPAALALLLLQVWVVELVETLI